MVGFHFRIWQRVFLWEAGRRCKPETGVLAGLFGLTLAVGGLFPVGWFAILALRLGAVGIGFLRDLGFLEYEERIFDFEQRVILRVGVAPTRRRTAALRRRAAGRCKHPPLVTRGE